ncbi:MAG: hypothetical protein ACYDDW_05260 [Dermatophilaceae bacterium]
MTDFKAQMQSLQQGLNTNLAQARGYADPSLSPEGLQARRQELANAVRAAAAPPLAALRAEVSSEAQTAADALSAALPKAGTDANATARTAAKWTQVAMKLDAGIPLADIVSRAGVDELHAIADYAPSWVEAASFKAGAGRGSPGQEAPDHTTLFRSVDSRLAELTGPTAVAALSAANEAAGVGAYVGVYADHLANVIAGIAQNPIDIGVSLAAADAEQLAIHGQAPADAPADAGAADAGAAGDGGA